MNILFDENIWLCTMGEACISCLNGSFTVISQTMGCELIFGFSNFYIHPDKTIKLWKISERCRRYSNLNTVGDDGSVRDQRTMKELRIPQKVSDEISVEAVARRVYSNAHTYHINSIAVNSDGCTYLSADDLRINIWHLENTDQSFSIQFG